MNTITHAYTTTLHHALTGIGILAATATITTPTIILLYVIRQANNTRTAWRLRSWHTAHRMRTRPPA